MSIKPAFDVTLWLWLGYQHIHLRKIAKKILISQLKFRFYHNFNAGFESQFAYEA